VFGTVRLSTVFPHDLCFRAESGFFHSEAPLGMSELASAIVSASKRRRGLSEQMKKLRIVRVCNPLAEKGDQVGNIAQNCQSRRYCQNRPWVLSRGEQNFLSDRKNF
jgi:hypothetical protein